MNKPPVGSFLGGSNTNTKSEHLLQSYSDPTIPRIQPLSQVSGPSRTSLSRAHHVSTHGPPSLERVSLGGVGPVWGPVGPLAYQGPRILVYGT